MYGDMPVIAEMIGRGAVLLDGVKGWLPEDESEHDFPTDDEGVISRHYSHLHEGFVWMMNAYLGSVCPATLGPEYLPEEA